MFNGVFCPSITIVKEDGSIDYDNWEIHLNKIADSGINGILLFGSIGEFFNFDIDEKKESIKFAKDLVGNKTKVFFGIGDTLYKNVIDLAKYGEEIGVDAVVAVSPYYFGPSDITAQAYYDGIANAINIPIILYNFPDRTGSDLNPDLVAKLVSKHKNIIGIKDTVDTISHTRRVLRAARLANPDFCVLSGFDEYYLVNRVSGGNGVLSGLTNIEPETFVAMHKAYEAKDFAKAIDCAQRISHLMSVYDVCDLFVSAIKCGVKAKGLDISTNLVDPATQASQDDLEKICNIIA